MSRLQQYFYFSQLAIVASLPFHFLASSYAVILSLLLFFINLSNKEFRNKIWQGMKSNGISKAFLLLFILYPLSFLIHLSDYENFNLGLSEIEKKLSYLLFPFLFASIVTWDNKQIITIFKVFVYAVLTSTLIALIAGLYFTITTGTLDYYDPVKEVVFNNFMYHRLGSYVGMHAVYFAEYVLFSLALVVHYSIQRFTIWSTRRKGLSIVLALYFVGVIFLLKSAAILIILLASILVFVSYYLFKARADISVRTKLILPVVTVILIIILGGRALDKIGLKSSYLSYDLAEPGGGEWNAINLRLAKWEAAALAIKDNLWLGVGPGNTEKALDQVYRNIGFDYALQLHYNPHNQYLHTFLALGIIGFCLLVYLIGLLFSSGFGKADIVLMVFLVSLSLFSISESTLAVNKGIVFFSVFAGIFSYLPKKLSAYIND